MTQLSVQVLVDVVRPLKPWVVGTNEAKKLREIIAGQRYPVAYWLHGECIK